MSSNLPCSVLGASPDTGNLGVSALCYATLDSLHRRGVGPLTLFDFGQGRRAEPLPIPGLPPIAKVGVSVGRRVYRPSHLAHMRLAAWLGGVWHPAARAVLDSSAVLDLSGGDSFTDLYGHKRWKQIVWPKLAAIDSGVPLILLPQTIGPFRDRGVARTARRVLLAADQVWTRDADSQERLAALLGAGFDPRRHRCGVDVAFALAPVDCNALLDPQVRTLVRRGEDRKPVAGVNVSGLLWHGGQAAASRFGLRDDYRSLTVDLVRRLLAGSDAEILLIPHVLTRHGHYESDPGAAEALVAALDERHRGRVHLVEGPAQPGEMKWLIAQCDWFTGARMHATIAALSSGVPTAGLAYSDKMRGVFASAAQGERSIDLREHANAEIVDRLWASWLERDTHRAAAAEAGRVIRNAACRQFDDIAGYIRSLPFGASAGLPCAA